MLLQPDALGLLDRQVVDLAAEDVPRKKGGCDSKWDFVAVPPARLCYIPLLRDLCYKPLSQAFV